jgi:hypothetical protein
MHNEKEIRAYYSNNKIMHHVHVINVYEWTQNDRLSKFCKDVEDVPRKKCINLRWKNDS